MLNLFENNYVKLLVSDIKNEVSTKLVKMQHVELIFTYLFENNYVKLLVSDVNKEAG